MLAPLRGPLAAGAARLLGSPARVVPLPVHLDAGPVRIVAPGPAHRTVPAVVDASPGDHPLVRPSGRVDDTHPGLGARVLHDAWITGGAMGAVVDGGCFAPPLTHPAWARAIALVPGLIAADRRAAVIRAPGRDDIAPDGILVTGPWQENWFHWVIDVLPRVLAARRLPDGLDRLPLLVAEEVLARPRFREALEAVVDGSEVVALRAGATYRVRRVVIVDDTNVLAATDAGSGRGAGPFLLNLELMRALRWEVLRRVGLVPDPPQAPDPSQRILVVRPRGAKRSYNQDDVVARLAEHGFSPFEPSEHPFAVQVQRFASAAVVCGPSGSAMTGLLFCHPHASALMWTFRQALEKTSLWSNLTAVAGSRLTMLPIDAPEGLTQEEYLELREYQVDPLVIERALRRLQLV